MALSQIRKFAACGSKPMLSDGLRRLKCPTSLTTAKRAQNPPQWVSSPETPYFLGGTPSALRRGVGTLDYGGVCLLITAILLCLTSSAWAQRTQRLPDQDTTASSVVDADGYAWVATPNGAFRIAGDSVTRFPDFKLDVTGIFQAGGHVWLATTQGAYRVDGDKVHRVPDRGLVVTSVADIAGDVWLATTTGAYRVQGDMAARTPDRDLDIAGIVGIDGQPWLATDQGAFQLLPPRSVGSVPVAIHIGNFDYDLNQILEIDGRPWIATDRGAFRIDPTGPHHIELVAPSSPGMKFTGKLPEVFRIIKTAKHIWFISTTGSFRVDGDRATRLPDQRNGISTIVGAGADDWIATRSGAYRIRGDVARRIPDLPLNVTGITPIGDTVWLATTQGAYAVRGDSVRRIPDDPLSISGISQAGGQTFLATANGAYVVTGLEAHPVLASDVDVMGLYTAGGNAWLTTPEGAFRVDLNHRLLARLTPLHPSNWTSWLQRLLPRGVSLAGDYSVRVAAQSTDGGESYVPEARVAIRPTLGSLRDMEANGQFVSPASTKVGLVFGQNSMQVAIRDGWMPPIEQRLSFLAIPIWIVLGGLVLVAWAFMAALTFALSPVSIVCHRAVMQPWLRGFGTLGVVPLLIRWCGPARRYLLIRYRHELLAALGSEPDPNDAVRLSKLCERLSNDRLADFAANPLAEPFATACHVVRASLQRGTCLGRLNAVPIPLLVSADEASDLAGMALTQLVTYGKVTDRGLARQLLAAGGFLYVIETDAGDTVSYDETVGHIRAFADLQSRRNLVCLVGLGEGT